MKHKKEKYAVGVLVGRFQVHELHEAHLNLIQSVCNEHDKVIIFLGLSPVKVTQNNPLDYESRRQMILKQFPEVIIPYIKDCADDEYWSKSLDDQISDIIGPNQTVILYGSRDSFIDHYTGKYNTQELIQEIYISGTEVRNSIGRKVMNKPAFRAGVIWASINQYPKTFPTVDIAILNEDETKILLGRKTYEKQYRFVGGFADPTSSSYEVDARREVMEEANIDITDPVYIGSFKIDDWRYAQEKDKIKTLFFVAKYFSGRPKAGDDICEVRWFDITNFYDEKCFEVGQDIIMHDDNLVDNHKILMKRFVEYMLNKKEK